MEVLRNGKFSLPISSTSLSKGLRKSKVNLVNNHSLLTCSGMFGKEGVLQRIPAMIRSFELTTSFPYPQVFVETNLVIVCTGTDIYEYINEALVLKLTVTEASTWSLVSFHDFVYISNGKVAVIRNPESDVYSITEDVPTAMAICNYKGQIIIGAPDAGYYIN